MSFAVIEGLDGSGKSTQIRLLQEYLSQKKVKYKFLHFPRTDAPFFGELIARFLRGELGNIDTVNPYLVALIYAGDRKDAAATISSWLLDDFLVIADRYVNSNIAFQCAKIKEEHEIDKLANWILKLEYEYYKIPKPDRNIFLDVPFAFTRSNLTIGRTGNDREYLKGNTDIHEENLDFQQNVREIYLQQAQKDDLFQLIDCSDNDGNILPPEKIFEKLISMISPLI